MKKLILSLILLILFSNFAYALEINENFLINDPSGDDTADEIIDGIGENFKLSFNSVYTINPIVWDMYANKRVIDRDNTCILYLTLNADNHSFGNNMETMLINAGSTNPLIQPRAIVTSAVGLNANTISALAIGDNSMPALFTGIGLNSKVKVDCDLEVTGQIINPQMQELTQRIEELEERLNEK